MLTTSEIVKLAKGIPLTVSAFRRMFPTAPPRLLCWENEIIAVLSRTVSTGGEAVAPAIHASIPASLAPVNQCSDEVGSKRPHPDTEKNMTSNMAKVAKLAKDASVSVENGTVFRFRPVLDVSRGAEVFAASLVDFSKMKDPEFTRHWFGIKGGASEGLVYTTAINTNASKTTHSHGKSAATSKTSCIHQHDPRLHKALETIANMVGKSAYAYGTAFEATEVEPAAEHQTEVSAAVLAEEAAAVARLGNITVEHVVDDNKKRKASSLDEVLSKDEEAEDGQATGSSTQLINLKPNKKSKIKSNSTAGHGHTIVATTAVDEKIDYSAVASESQSMLSAISTSNINNPSIANKTSLKAKTGKPGNAVPATGALRNPYFSNPASEANPTGASTKELIPARDTNRTLTFSR